MQEEKRPKGNSSMVKLSLGQFAKENTSNLLIIRLKSSILDGDLSIELRCPCSNNSSKEDRCLCSGEAK